jgi:hypothetical protein
MTTATELTSPVPQTRDLFIEIIEDWKKRKILDTLTREERDREYEIALEKLHDFIEEEAMQEDYDTLQDLRRIRIRSSLRDRTLTKEEQKQEMKKSLDWWEKILGKKLNYGS